MKLAQGARAVFPRRVRIGVLPRHALLLQGQAHAQLPLREGADLAALPRRACAAPLFQRRGALYRLQAVRGDLARPRRSRSRPVRAATTARAVPRATTSTWSNASIAGSARRLARSMPSSKGRTSSSRPRPARSFYFDKERLLANGDRWEREIAKKHRARRPIPVIKT